MAQGMIVMGDLIDARTQLNETRTRDERQTWSEIAL